MKRLALAAILILSAAAFGCASFPKDDIQIEAEPDPKVNYSAYKTYSWVGSAQVLDDPAGIWEPIGFDADAEITFLIEKELRKRGMSPSDENPDVLVAFAVGVDTAATKFKDDPEKKIRILENVPQGALVIVMVDPQTEIVTWAAIAVAELQNQGDEVARKRLNYTVTEMFKKLPK